jgi:hypothetical protein
VGNTLWLRTMPVLESQTIPCRYCGDNIAWVKSNRTGKSYPVNFYRTDKVPNSSGIKDAYYVSIIDFHNCRKQGGLDDYRKSDRK